jgi:hypothetical protein
MNQEIAEPTGRIDEPWPLTASLFTLATFVHVSMNKSENVVLDGGEIERQCSILATQD